MANICDTCYRCTGKKEELKELYDAIQYNDKLEKPLLKNGFGNLWLGCIISRLGGNWEDYQCRGEIEYYELDEKNCTLTIDQSTCWDEQEGFREFIEQRFPSIKVYYLEEELGFGIYNTNDREGKFFNDKYRLELEIETLFLQTIEGLAKRVSQETGRELQPDIDEIKKAVDQFNDEHSEDDAYMNLLELTYSD